MNHAKQYEQIFSTSCGLPWRRGMLKTRVERFWSGISRWMSTCNSLGQFSHVCWGVVHVVQPTWDFRPEVLSRVQIRWHTRPIQVLHILIFDEIHDASRSVCWRIVILEHKICMEVSPSKWKHFGFQDTYVLVLIHVSIQYVELEFPFTMEGTSYRDSAAACLYSKQYTIIE